MDGLLDDEEHIADEIHDRVHELVPLGLMIRVLTALAAAGAIIACGSTRQPATPTTERPPPVHVSAARERGGTEAMPACTQMIRPAAESTRYWAKQLNLRLWPSRSGGLAPGDRVRYVAVGCEIDETGASRQVRCGAAMKPSRYDSYRDIVGKCFTRDDVPSDTAAGNAVVHAWDSAGGPDQMWTSLRALAQPATYMHIQIQHRWLAEEHETISCGPRRDPNAPICDEAVGPPTGRKIPAESTYDYVVGPPGTPDGAMPFQEQPFWANGVNVGRWTDHFEPDPNLGTPDSSWFDYFAKFWCVPIEGTRELRGAVLVNRAIGAFANGNAAAGRQATAELRALVASGPLQGEVLLPGTLDTLQAAGSSAWLVADPCQR